MTSAPTSGSDTTEVFGSNTSSVFDGLTSYLGWLTGAATTLPKSDIVNEVYDVLDEAEGVLPLNLWKQAKLAADAALQAINKTAK